MVSRRFLTTILSLAMAVLLIAGTVPVLANPATIVSPGSTSMPLNNTVMVSNTVETGAQPGLTNIRLDYHPSMVKVSAGAAGDLEDLTASVDNISGSLRMVAAYGNIPGRTGTLKFADITLEALEAPGTDSPLNIAVVDMYNSAVQPIASDAINNSTCSIVSRLEGYINNGGVISSADNLLVARTLQESSA
jgi:hypothetical protein